MKEVVLDTETTGISIKDGHRVVEIGCIELENLIPTKNKFHCYLNPERKVSEKALEVHGYTDEFLATQKKFSDIGEQFLEFIKSNEKINLDLLLYFLTEFKLIFLGFSDQLIMHLYIPNDNYIQNTDLIYYYG